MLSVHRVDLAALLTCIMDAIPGTRIGMYVDKNHRTMTYSDKDITYCLEYDGDPLRPIWPIHPAVMEVLQREALIHFNAHTGAWET